MGRHAATAWRCALCSAYATEATPRSKHKPDLCEDCYESLAPRNLAWCARGKHRVAASDMKPKRACRLCRRAADADYRARNREAVCARRRKRYHTDAAYRARCYASSRVVLARWRLRKKLNTLRGLV